MVISREICQPTGKVMYRSSAEAIHEANVSHGPMRVYSCKLCRMYHLTPQRGKKKRRMAQHE